ncbi:hypothetical protein DFJ58DRAFT_770778 [Suillus subalutaceus]|uniref:uncharacterized protein n=1 Tax=Suillus subalutaceus TaxID=48586 RepID=UPI001B86B2AD|nr:uncharacterized protein DFJ58DRAFT_770778 [Suillus subalutaceus]KAG1865916.1 hypothetical protein DFJ58DRAFT_770778 [Suillus subalutaceus]
MRLSTLLLACHQLNGAYSHSMWFPALWRYFSSFRTFAVRPIRFCAQVLIMMAHHAPFIGQRSCVDNVLQVWLVYFYCLCKFRVSVKTVAPSENCSS